MEECIFCKIASGEIQGLRIYENNETLAFNTRIYGYCQGC